jgi:anti-anti-sigma factor
LASASQYRAQLITAVPNTARGLVVDLTGITYLDSRGVHLVLDLAERMRTTQQQLRLVVPPSSVIRRVLLLTQVDRIVPMHDTLEDALRQMRVQES